MKPCVCLVSFFFFYSFPPRTSLSCRNCIILFPGPVKAAICISPVGPSEKRSAALFFAPGGWFSALRTKCDLFQGAILAPVARDPAKRWLSRVPRFPFRLPLFGGAASISPAASFLVNSFLSLSHLLIRVGSSRLSFWQLLISQKEILEPTTY